MRKGIYQKKSRFYGVVAKPHVLPCPYVIEWLTRKVYHERRTLLGFEENHVASYQALVLNQMYHFNKAEIKVAQEWLQNKFESINYLDIMKGWWLEGNFRYNTTPIGRKISKLQKRIQIMVILLSRIFGRKDSSHFPNKWILIIHQVISSGPILNWGEIISSNLDIQLKWVRNEHKFYMDSYLLDVMCASKEYPSLRWKWTPGLRPSMYIVRCYGKINTWWIMT